ncbi:DNA-binding protein [Candidatus Shapirobacteria bacterium]|nr:DNA-binding protein [Candidatus Shapirobacteria bacterium]
MKKSQITELVARKAHITKKGAVEVIDTFLDEVGRTLQKGEKVVLSGFGTFKTVLVKDKPVVYPKTKEKKIVKSHRAARFSPGKLLKRLIK